MNLNLAYDFLNFWINKFTGSFYTMAELDLIVDRGQMAYYTDLYSVYGTSQRASDSLSVFRASYTFTNGTAPLGLVTLPSDYLDFIDAYTIIMDATNTVRQRPVPLLNPDEVTYRVNSQVIPPTTTDPFGEIVGDGVLQLYPKVAQAGVVRYFKRPAAPYYAYSVISGRVIVYDPTNSVQLQWSERDISGVLLKALASIGINIREEDVQNWSEQKTAQNYQNVNRT